MCEQRKPQKKGFHNPKRAFSQPKTQNSHPRTECPASGETCSKCSHQGHVAKVCYGKKRHTGSQHQAHHVGARGAEAAAESSDSDCVFSLKEPSKSRPTVTVTMNGVKGKADADSCLSANVMDFQQLQQIAQASKKPMMLQPAENTLYAYAQTSPIAFTGKFTASCQQLEYHNRQRCHCRVPGSGGQGQFQTSNQFGHRSVARHYTHNQSYSVQARASHHEWPAVRGVSHSVQWSGAPQGHQGQVRC